MDDCKDYYTKTPQFYLKVLKQNDRELKEFFKNEDEYLLENIKPNSIVLDVGCGVGKHICLLSPISEKVVGLDFNEKFLGISKENTSKLTNVELVLANALNMPFEDSMFDYSICMFNTLGNISNREKILNEMKRVTKNSGKLIVSVYSKAAKQYQKSIYEDIGLTISKETESATHTEQGLVSKRFTKNELLSIFNSRGLKVKIQKLCKIGYICEAIVEK